MKVTAIFDIGKTNKKCFLFDKDYREVQTVYAQFAEGQDEDGDPCDDLTAITEWVRQTLADLLRQSDYTIEAVNFSTYGASFVHLDRHGQPLTPLYNYLKPYPPDLLDRFYKQYGPAEPWSRATASPALGMLNSGLQLYWLKHTRPDVFARVRYSLHLPQYLSYLCTGIPVSEYTSIGCHTGLWDYKRHDYHAWVYVEGIDSILPPIVPTHTSINVRQLGRHLRVGVGIHDSSAALLPYIRAEREPFVLVSTGTWSITLNAFGQDTLTADELAADCLNFMRVNGQPVRAARLFLGHEYQQQVERLQQHFHKTSGSHKHVAFDEGLYQQLHSRYVPRFAFEHLTPNDAAPAATDLTGFSSFEEAYHQLLLELVVRQCAAIDRAVGTTAVKKIYIDGGFADNAVFVQSLAREYPHYTWRTTQAPLGSALGAALIVNDRKVRKKFLKKHYAMRKTRIHPTK